MIEIHFLDVALRMIIACSNGVYRAAKKSIISIAAPAEKLPGAAIRSKLVNVRPLAHTSVRELLLLF